MKSSELIFINAYFTKNSEEKSALIQMAVEIQFDSIVNLPFGPEYLINLNLNMVILYLKHSSDQLYKEITLEKILDVCPAHIDSLLMLSSIQNNQKSHHTLKRIIELDPTNSKAHLMVANLLIKQVNIVDFYVSKYYKFITLGS